MNVPHHFTRRNLLVASIGMFPSLRASSTFAQSATPDATPAGERPYELLGDGIAVTDFRIIPDTAPTRFILEITSERDDDVDTPLLGASNYATGDSDPAIWAIPWSPVLLAHESTFATGLLPSAYTPHEPLDWEFCSASVAAGENTEQRSTWQWESASEVEIVSDKALRVYASITNTGSTTIRGAEVLADFRDATGRFCGGAPLGRTTINPGQTVKKSVGFNAN